LFILGSFVLQKYVAQIFGDFFTNIFHI
jgi:hypothetical protein